MEGIYIARNMDSIGKYILEIILLQQRTPQLLKQKKLMQTQKDHSNPILALNVDSLKVDLVVIQNTCFEKEDCNSETKSSKSVKESSLDSVIKDMGNVKKSVAERTHHQRQYDTRVNKKQMQTQKCKVDTGKALEADLVVTKSSETESEVQDDSIRSRNDTNTDDVDTKPIYDEEPMAEVQLTAECNIFATRQQHTEQPKIITEGRVDQYTEQCQVQSPILDSLLDNQTTEYSKQSLESENILLKKSVA
ncbi:hypothetical protein Tco_0894013 [Tanacetum coccineum]|uniref:Uncharacterized protein n=1 Tax=Tanacetum coccineum TaxID=301880 RepID=A0ABQ5CDR8_9ASTR